MNPDNPDVQPEKSWKSGPTNAERWAGNTQEPGARQINCIRLEGVYEE
jgi:hypothetical protein